MIYVLLLPVSFSSFVNGFQINNAGISRIGSIENASLDGFDRIMKTNVRAVYHPQPRMGCLEVTYVRPF